MHMNTPRTVIITGASSGLGFALAEAFLERGDNVVGNARSQARLEQAAARLGNPSRFIGVAGDIAEQGTAQRLFASAEQAFGGVDLLINNAGIFIAAVCRVQRSGMSTPWSAPTSRASSTRPRKRRGS